MYPTISKILLKNNIEIKCLVQNSDVMAIQSGGLDLAQYGIASSNIFYKYVTKKSSKNVMHICPTSKCNYVLKKEKETFMVLRVCLGEYVSLSNSVPVCKVVSTVLPAILPR